MSFRNGRWSAAQVVATPLVLAMMVTVAACSGNDDAVDAIEHKTGAATSDSAAAGGDAVLNAQIARAESALPDSMPGPLREAIIADLPRFSAMVDSVLAQPPELTWLVDKENPLPADYEPDDLVPLADQAGLVVNRSDMMLREIVIEPLQQMTAAAAVDGVTLDLSSAYRSYDYQAGLFQRNVEQLGLEQAERESARAGTSQHQLGTTVDFGSITPAFANTDAGRWLAENAWRFGFSLSYPDGYEAVTGYMYESWHFRFVGMAATQLEREHFGGIQQWMLVYLNAPGVRPPSSE